MPPPSVIGPERLGGRRWAQHRNRSGLEEMSHATRSDSIKQRCHALLRRGQRLQPADPSSARAPDQPRGRSGHLRVEIDPHDQAAFVQYTTRWLRALSQRGTAVEVEVLEAG